MPPWTCQLSTTRPVVGEPVTIEVRYWWDPEHSEPADMAIFGRLRSLTAVAIDYDEPGEFDFGVIPITLPRVDPSTYRGNVVLPDTRRFRVASCGGGYNKRGYPLRRGVVVAPRGRVGAQGPGVPMSTFTIGLVVLAAVVVAILKTRSRGWLFPNRLAHPGRLERL
jgi:hypothetical protein